MQCKKGYNNVFAYCKNVKSTIISKAGSTVTRCTTDFVYFASFIGYLYRAFVHSLSGLLINL